MPERIRASRQIAHSLPAECRDVGPIPFEFFVGTDPEFGKKIPALLLDRIARISGFTTEFTYERPILVAFDFSDFEVGFGFHKRTRFQPLTAEDRLNTNLRQALPKRGS